MLTKTQAEHLDLNLLRVFKALYTEQNMTRAAEVLNVTPSAVSHAVKRLRSHLNDPLFERRENRMLPTATCRRMAPELIELVTQLHQHLQSWAEFDPCQSDHRFRIGMHDAIEPSLLPQLARVLAVEAPNISFTSVAFDRATMAKDLAAGVLDVALDVSIPTNQEIRSELLTNNRFVVLMRKHHPLHNALTSESYLNASHLVVSRRPSGFSVEDSQLLEAGMQRRTLMRCQNYAAGREIVAESDLLLTLSTGLAKRFAGPDLIIEPLPMRLPGFATQLYWHQSYAHDPALTWLRGVIGELFEQTSL